MRILVLACALFVGAFIAFAPRPSFAGELRILDSMGLTRAVKSIQDEATVRVSLRGGGADASTIVLSHVDGLAPDINPSSVSASGATFSGVPEGAWRIKAASAKVVIAEVKIEQ